MGACTFLQFHAYQAKAACGAAVCACLLVLQCRVCAMIKQHSCKVCCSRIYSSFRVERVGRMFPGAFSMRTGMQRCAPLHELNTSGSGDCHRLSFLQKYLFGPRFLQPCCRTCWVLPCHAVYRQITHSAKHIPNKLSNALKSCNSTHKNRVLPSSQSHMSHAFSSSS